MKIGPKFKIARRLGAPIFEKTQTQKFKASEERRSKKGKSGRPRPKSEYGHQLIEKQKARFSYGVSEKQFGNYAKKVIAKKGATEPQARLFEELERRLDNVVYRLGLAKTRLFARQMVSHGHITVNERKVTIPSMQVKKGDKIGVREGSKSKAMWASLEEKGADVEVPSWLRFDASKKSGIVEGIPVFAGQSLVFDLSAVLEFYKR